jgi:hypothetical protein
VAKLTICDVIKRLPVVKKKAWKGLYNGRYFGKVVVITRVNVNIPVFRDLVPCGLTEGYCRFRRNCCPLVSAPW